MDDIIDKFNGLSVGERPTVPKGRRTAYMFFQQHISSEMKRKGETYKGIGQFSKICSQKWKELTDKEKEKYHRMSAEDMSRYQKEMAVYDKKKSSYDDYIDEIHDKGYLKDLDDNRHVMDLTIFGSSSAVERNNSLKDKRSNDDEDSDTEDDDSAEDTINDEDEEEDQEENDEEENDEEETDEEENSEEENSEKETSEQENSEEENDEEVDEEEEKGIPEKVKKSKRRLFR